MDNGWPIVFPMNSWRSVFAGCDGGSPAIAGPFIEPFVWKSPLVDESRPLGPLGQFFIGFLNLDKGFAPAAQIRMVFHGLAPVGAFYFAFQVARGQIVGIQLQLNQVAGFHRRDDSDARFD